MKQTNYSHLVLGALAAMTVACGNQSEQKTDNQTVSKDSLTVQNPNIIYILVDDLGYGDLGCYGQDSILTPHIDQMATDGMRFTQHYAGSTVSAPSRCCLMTGLHTGHARIRGNARVPLRAEDTTVAELLKQAGYSTALIGKWGLGQDGTSGAPNNKGFDYFYGYLNQTHAHNSYPAYLWRNTEKVMLDNEVIIAEEGYAKGIGGVSTNKATHSHDLFTKEALRFIDANKDTSFFIYLAYTIPHANNEGWLLDSHGMEAPDTTLYADKDWPAAQRAHAAMITYMDKDIGKLRDKLNALGIAENTLIIFTSDNGPHKEGGADPAFFDSNGPLKGMKRDLYEGGIRVPMIAVWPNKVQAGQSSDHISAFWDFLPTACEVAGIEVPENTDGISFLPVLTGKEQAQHDYLYWEFYEQKGRQAIRKGQWKAIRQEMTDKPDAPIELYDLSLDIGEENNVASDNQEVVEKMKQLFKAARKASDDFKFDYERE